MSKTDLSMNDLSFMMGVMKSRLQRVEKHLGIDGHPHQKFEMKLRETRICPFCQKKPKEFRQIDPPCTDMVVCETSFCAIYGINIPRVWWQVRDLSKTK